MNKSKQWKSKDGLNGAPAIPPGVEAPPEAPQDSGADADATGPSFRTHAFCTLSLDPQETLATYQALRFYSRAITSQEADALETLEIVVGVMKALRPAAQRAAALFQPTIKKE